MKKSFFVSIPAGLVMGGIGMVIAVLLLSGCSNCAVGQKVGNKFKGIAPGKTTTRKVYDSLDAFDAVTFSSVGQVLVRQKADTYSVSVEGPDNYVPLYEVKSKDGELTISVPDNVRLKDASDMRIIVEVPTVSRLVNEGVGRLLSARLDVPRLQLVNGGVGAVVIRNLKAGSLEADNEGVGQIELTGEADTVKYVNEGVGKIDALLLKGKSVTARNEGVGAISLSVSESLRAKNEGVGNIRYAGAPSDVKISSDGIGRVKQVK